MRLAKVPTSVQQFDIFEFIRYKVVECNESWDVLCLGQKGVGKSSTTLSAASFLDPNYSLERWAFTTEDLLRMRQIARAGNVIVSDEMGTQESLSSQNWYDDDSKEAVDLHQLDRTERIINMATTLDIGRINNRVRNQYKVLLYIRKKLTDEETGGNGMATRCAILFVEEDFFAHNEHDRYKPKYFRNEHHQRITEVDIPHPLEDMFRVYSKRRKDFQEILRLKRINDSQAEVSNSKGKAESKVEQYRRRVQND